MAALLEAFHGYQDLVTHYQQLESNGYIESLTLILNEISKSSLPSNSPQSFSNNCKIILSTLIDRAFTTPKTNAKGIKKTVPKPSIKTFVRAARMNENNHYPEPSTDLAKTTESLLNLRNSCSYNALKKKKNRNKEESLLSPPYEGKIEQNSGFSHIQGPGTFSRGKRSFEFRRNTSPGPAAYKPNASALSPKAPRATIPVGGKRIEFGHLESPGPSAYYPLTHYLSR